MKIEMARIDLKTVPTDHLLILKGFNITNKSRDYMQTPIYEYTDCLWTLDFIWLSITAVISSVEPPVVISIMTV